jgi:hypothetical protein
MPPAAWSGQWVSNAGGHQSRDLNPVFIAGTEWQREEEQSKAEWDAFINWVRQHPVTDLNRLFDWLKAQRDLKEFGLDIGLPSQPKLDD